MKSFGEFNNTGTIVRGSARCSHSHTQHRLYSRNASLASPVGLQKSRCSCVKTLRSSNSSPSEETGHSLGVCDGCYTVPHPEQVLTVFRPTLEVWVGTRRSGKCTGQRLGYWMALCHRGFKAQIDKGSASPRLHFQVEARPGRNSPDLCWGRAAT